MKRKPFECVETVQMNREELVFHKINGLIDGDAAPDIPDETEPGGQLEWYVAQVYEARKQLCAKSGIPFEGDPDLDGIMDGYEALCHICGVLMYRYGLRDGLAHQQ